ncbi:MAG: hypothetical protein PUI81_08780 [Veillonellaceae bacterium]|nr:hypothetical protein [Veillonellaceae bacterium]
MTRAAGTGMGQLTMRTAIPGTALTNADMTKRASIGMGMIKKASTAKGLIVAGMTERAMTEMDMIGMDMTVTTSTVMV